MAMLRYRVRRLMPCLKVLYMSDQSCPTAVDTILLDNCVMNLINVVAKIADTYCFQMLLFHQYRYFSQNRKREGCLHFHLVNSVGQYMHTYMRTYSNAMHALTLIGI